MRIACIYVSRHVLRSFAASKQQLLLQLNSHLGEEDRADFVLVEYIMADI